MEVHRRNISYTKIRVNFRTNEQGVALVISLLLIAILLVIVVELTFTVQVNDNLSHNYTAELQNLYAAKAGVEYAKALLIEDQIEEDEDKDDTQESPTNEPTRQLQVQGRKRNKGYDSLKDVWAEPSKHEITIDIGGEEEDGCRVSIWVIDEARKLNINNLASKNRIIRKACREQLKRLLDKVLEIDDAERVADKIIKLVSGKYAEEDEGTVTRKRRPKDKDERGEEEGRKFIGSGDERSDRSVDDLRGGNRKGNPLYTIAELRNIDGVTDDVFYGRPDDPESPPGLVEVLTTWSSGKVNINTAEPEVLASLAKDVDDKLIGEILERREEEPFEDINALKDLSGVLSRNSTFRHSITVRSSVFTVLVRSQQGNMIKTAMAVLTRGDKSVAMLQWEENSEIAKALVEKFLTAEEEE